MLLATGADVAIEIGEKVYLAGHSAGITPEAWDSPHRISVNFVFPELLAWRQFEERSRTAKICTSRPWQTQIFGGITLWAADRSPQTRQRKIFVLS